MNTYSIRNIILNYKMSPHKPFQETWIDVYFEYLFDLVFGIAYQGND